MVTVHEHPIEEARLALEGTIADMREHLCEDLRHWTSYFPEAEGDEASERNVTLGWIVDRIARLEILLAELRDSVSPQD